MILLEKMDIDDAKNIFGLSTIPNAADLKTMWKDLAKKNHPDFGGSAEKMQDINAAYDLLSTYAGTSSSSSYSTTDWREREKEEKEKQKVFFAMAENLFDKSFDEKKLVDYLSDFVTDTLTANIKKPQLSKISSYREGYKVDVEISNSDNTLVIFLSYYISRASNSGGLGYTGMDVNEILFNISVGSNIYFNKRKFKVAQSEWNWRAGTKTLTNYDELFPKAKLKKIFATDTSTRVFKKKDMLLGLERELDVKFNDEYIYIYFFGLQVEYYLVMYRAVMMRTATYNFARVQGKPKDYADKRQSYVDRIETHSIYETEENLNKLIEVVKDVVHGVGDMDVDEMTEKDMKEVTKIVKKELDKQFPKG